MKAIEFNNKENKKITISEFESLMNTIGLNFYGFKNISTNDRDLFEDKLNASFEFLKDGTIVLHDLNYTWED